MKTGTSRSGIIPHILAGIAAIFAALDSSSTFAAYSIACYYYDSKDNYDNNNPSLMFQDPARKNFYWSIDEGFDNLAPSYTELSGSLVDGIFVEEALTRKQLVDKCNKSIAEGRPFTTSKPTYRLLEYSAAKGSTSPTEFGYEYPIFFSSDDNPSTINRIVVFGDSLSDNDNLKRWIKVMPEYPYWFGRFTNGLNWSDYLARSTNTTVFNWAIGGAKSAKTSDASASQIIKYIKSGGRNFITGSMDTSIDRYLESWLSSSTGINQSAAQQTAYILWIGANDYLEKFDDSEDFKHLLENPDQSGGYEQVSTRAVSNIIANIDKLADRGALNFIVPNLPDIGYTPTIASTQNFDFSTGSITDREQLSSAVTRMVKTHNAKLKSAIAALRERRGSAINVLEIDVYADFSSILQGTNPFNGSAFDAQFVNELSDVTSPGNGLKIPKSCFSGGYLAITRGATNKSWKEYASQNTCKAAGNFNSYSTYWDQVHPSSYSHCLLSYTFHKRMYDAALLTVEPVSIEAFRDYCRSAVPK